ncbi:GNAT family N-acetyltransferase [Streptomyces nanhaiensis]|uniref:GNAT family N-acetyltransferase n=1 Tax=Streptomyces nanhaiensis TaxID=679319 RepID=UPI00399D3364
MIRQAVSADAPVLHTVIREPAEHERSPERAGATEERSRDALFREHPVVPALIAEDGDSGGPVGFAPWFLGFPTWSGTHGVRLEDLYVRPAARGAGHGRALPAELARVGAGRGYERFHRWVLNWNEPAIGFCESLGAEPMDEWTVHRLSGEPLRVLAAGRTPGSPGAGNNRRPYGAVNPA